MRRRDAEARRYAAELAAAMPYGYSKMNLGYRRLIAKSPIWRLMFPFIGIFAPQ